jgi:hypothetical protein
MICKQKKRRSVRKKGVFRTKPKRGTIRLEPLIVPAYDTTSLSYSKFEDDSRVIKLSKLLKPYMKRPSLALSLVDKILFYLKFSIGCLE